jgi:hypothetical protein
MAVNGLSTERLRELARAGAEQAVKQLRAEIIAIERTFPELKLPHARHAVRQSVTEATLSDSADVGGGSKGGLDADETLLGRAAEGAGQGQVRQLADALSRR